MIHIFNDVDHLYSVKKSELIAKIATLFMLIFFMGCFIGSLTVEPARVEVVKLVDNVIYVTEPDREFNPETLKEVITELNIKFPHIVYAQAVEETGFFTSTIFRENNNLFGMKEPRIRATTAIGTNRGHAQYSNWMNSVKDYALWQSTVANGINSENEYLLLLGRIYAENPNYVRNLERIIDGNELLAYFN